MYAFMGSGVRGAGTLRDCKPSEIHLILIRCMNLSRKYIMLEPLGTKLREDK